MIGGDGGAPHRLLLTIQDISDQHDAQMRLRESEANLRALFDNMLDLFYRNDVDGHLTMLSPSVSQVLGYSAEELIGTRVQELFWDPADWQKNDTAQKAANGVLRDAEFALRRADGQKVIVEINEYWERERTGKCRRFDRRGAGCYRETSVHGGTAQVAGRIGTPGG